MDSSTGPTSGLDHNGTDGGFGATVGRTGTTVTFSVTAAGALPGGLVRSIRNHPFRDCLEPRIESGFRNILTDLF